MLDDQYMCVSVCVVSISFSGFELKVLNYLAWLEFIMMWLVKGWMCLVSH